jgi:hypothetical protein
MHESEVIRKFIFSALRSKTAGEIVIPSRDPAAKVGDRQLIKPVFSKVLVGEHADTSEMVQDRFQVEVRIMTAGKSLEIREREGTGDGMEIDDVADHEAVMPGARL